jgi:hypothetical protein
MEDSANTREVMITKASGHTEPFDINKLKASLQNAGAKEDAITEVVNDIHNWVHEGVTTRKLYSRAFSILKRISTSGALLYKLKQAIIDMGPSGFPFEHFIGEIFRRWGYEVMVGIVMEGASIYHEMDVIANKDQEHILAECKFSIKQGHSVSIQVPLYVHSRVDDIVEKLQQDEMNQGLNFTAWIVTNGRFSPDSIAYSKRKGIHLMGWDYPRNHALKDVIEREKMFPITILSNLNLNEKKALMAQGIVTCAQLLQHREKLDRLGFSKKKHGSIIGELEALAGIGS